MCWWCLDRLVIRISSHLHAVSANTRMGMREQKRGWRLWEMMSGRTVVWLELYSYLDRKTNEWWVHQQCCLMTQSGTEWRGRRSQLPSTPSTKDISKARTWWPVKKTQEVLRFVEELVSLVLCVTQSNSGQSARPHILVLVSLCDSETESYYFTQYFLLILFKILPFSSMPALSFAVSCCIS